MKKINILFFIGIAALLSSCAMRFTDSKDIKYMGIRFAPLARTDFTLVGNLQVESVITGKMTGKGKILDKEFAKNLKQGRVSTYESTEVLYFAPGKGESMTGSLYDNDIFNLVRTPVVAGSKPPTLFNMLFGKLMATLQKAGLKPPTVADPALDFAYYAMVEKYKDVDYFINVRFDRKIEVKGKKFTESVTVKADGITLKTD